jgi:hypothetical protein
MAFGWTRSRRTGLALALLVSVGVLLGLSAVAHSHDGGFSPSHCEACRWTSNATPILAVLLIFLLTLPESGPTHVAAEVLRPQASRRLRRPRGPPLD